MSIMNKTLAALALSLCISTAHAALVNFTLTGTVIYPDANNAFGLTNGDFVTVTGIFDDVAIPGGTVYFDNGSGNSFTINAGNFSYSNAVDDDYGSGGYPQLVFSGGPLPDLQFWHTGATTFISGDGFFDGYDGSYPLGTMGGTWTKFDMSPVPVPAAVWLLGSGLLGLVGVSRRKVSI